MLKLESLCFPPRANFMSIQTPGNYTQILFSFAFFNIYVSDSMLYIFFFLLFFCWGRGGREELVQHVQLNRLVWFQFHSSDTDVSETNEIWESAIGT